MKSIFSLWIARISLGFLFIFIFFLQFYSDSFFSTYWHYLNPDPIRWKGFEVTIPKPYVAKSIPFAKTKDFIIFPVDPEANTHITFGHFPFQRWRDKFNLATHLKEKGFGGFNNESCQINKQFCVWIRSVKITSEKTLYREDIIFSELDAWLTFESPDRNRKPFLEIVENIKISR